MRIAVASGKGGTGKTTIATNLAYVAALAGGSVAYLDCDVEAPNGAIFLKPKIGEDNPVTTSVPKVDLDKCTGCGLCGEVCQFSAIVSMNKTVLTFPELCHGCAGCWLACPAGAIREDQQEIGRVQTGAAGQVRFLQGLLNIGQAMSSPLIRAVKTAAPQADLTIIDCPPGTSCPVIEAVRGSCYVLLVSEPTPFGLHDLSLAIETVRELGIPLGVVINRCDSGDARLRQYCDDNAIAVLAEIPDVRAVAEAYSRGMLAAELSGHYRQGFERLIEALRREVGR
ncbi:MAG: ATP-binding protein [Planctomycetaceae bacterium]|nr:ATP-binding protein [Planctomycetaceae bacterium]